MFVTLSSSKITIVGNLSRKPVFYEELFLCTFICTSIGTIAMGFEFYFQPTD